MSANDKVAATFHPNDGPTPTAQEVPIPGDWPARALEEIRATSADMLDVTTRALVLAETAQGDADALREAVLDCLSIYEAAESKAAGGDTTSRWSWMASAAERMRDRLEALSGPNVLRETSVDDDLAS